MSTWPEIAERIASSFELRPGGLVVLRDRCGRSEVVEAVAVAFERRGITTVIDPASDYVLDAVLSSTEPALLGTWGRHRSAILEFADAVVTLGAWPAPIERASEGALRALRAGREMMEEVEARRALPFLAVAIATPRLADDLGLALETLDSLVRASLSPPVDTLRQLIEANISKATADPLVLRTSGCALRMKRGRRPWLHDDGHISTGDVASGAVTSNLPCGSIYTTVLEDSADGTVRVPELADGLDIVLTFNSGAITAVDGPGSETVMPWLAQFGPDAARISHIGIGLNDACPGGTGWPILDEHRAGAVFLALGENRYMGGTNASSLNHDLVLDTASIDAGSVPLVIDGHLAS